MIDNQSVFFLLQTDLHLNVQKVTLCGHNIVEQNWFLITWVKNSISALEYNLFWFKRILKMIVHSNYQTYFGHQSGNLSFE